MKPTRALLAIFFDKVEVDERGCWLWRTSRNSSGYGVFVGGENAHRVAYRWFVGDIPEAFVIDHLCRVRSCVNPAHLEAVTQSVNLLRGNRARGICRRGHPWVPENLFRFKNGNRESVTCATCRREKRDARRKAVA